jgi:hypothetical protein
LDESDIGLDISDNLGQLDCCRFEHSEWAFKDTLGWGVRCADMIDVMIDDNQLEKKTFG